ncbi:MAG: FecR family protein [Niabella sp.]
MEQDRILELLIKRKIGEITLPEQNELHKLLKQHPDKEVDAAIIDEYFSLKIGLKNVEPDFINNSSLKLKQLIALKANSQKNRAAYKKLWKAIAVAASVLLVVLLSFLLINQSKSNKLIGSENQVYTKKGSKTNLVLPDGTKVWVNSDSRLTYSKSFGDNLREVYLTGEAYFDVVKDKDHPFIVHTDNMQVRVLGTAFNVKAYSNDVTTQAALIRGSIEVQIRDNKEKIILKPNEKLIVQNAVVKKEKPNPIANSGNEKVSIPLFALVKIEPNIKDSSISETQWVQNRLSFQKQSITELIPTLERWYNVKIIVKNDKSISADLLSGTFSNDALADVLESLKLSAGIQYKISKDTVLIY